MMNMLLVVDLVLLGVGAVSYDALHAATGCGVLPNFVALHGSMVALCALAAFRRRSRLRWVVSRVAEAASLAVIGFSIACFAYCQTVLGPHKTCAKVEWLYRPMMAEASGLCVFVALFAVTLVAARRLLWDVCSADACEDREDRPEDIRGDSREDTREDPRKPPRWESREDTREDTREDAREDTREDAREGTRVARELRRFGGKESGMTGVAYRCRDPVFNFAVTESSDGPRSFPRRCLDDREGHLRAHGR
jgi:hypothetical protein